MVRPESGNEGTRNGDVIDVGDDLARLEAHLHKVTHDLSNALGAVANYTTFLAEDLTTAGVGQEYLPHLENAVRRALDLVDKLGSPLTK